MLLDETWPKSVQLTALLSFAQVAEPLDQVDGLLQSLHSDDPQLSSSALLVLASLGQTVAAGDSARYDRIEEYVLDTADTSELGSDAHLLALEAIGNLSPSAVPACARAPSGCWRPTREALGLGCVPSTVTQERFLLTDLWWPQSHSTGTATAPHPIWAGFVASSSRSATLGEVAQRRR